MRRVCNIGCGHAIDYELPDMLTGPDWDEVTVDIDPRTEPDVVADMLALPADWTGAFNAVYSSHTLEHLYAHEVPVALAEMQRILRPGGGIILRVPDLQQACTWVALGKPEDVIYVSPGGAVTAMDMIYGYRPYVASAAITMVHKTGFTELTLLAAMARAGFERITVSTDGHGLWGMGWKAGGP